MQARSPGAHKKFLLHAYMESSTTHKIRKNGRIDFGWWPIFLFLCPESISKVDPACLWRYLTVCISDSIIRNFAQLLNAMHLLVIFCIALSSIVNILILMYVIIHIQLEQTVCFTGYIWHTSGLTKIRLHFIKGCGTKIFIQFEFGFFIKLSKIYEYFP